MSSNPNFVQFSFFFIDDLDPFFSSSSLPRIRITLHSDDGKILHTQITCQAKKYNEKKNKFLFDENLAIVKIPFLPNQNNKKYLVELVNNDQTETYSGVGIIDLDSSWIIEDVPQKIIFIENPDQENQLEVGSLTYSFNFLNDETESEIINDISIKNNFEELSSTEQNQYKKDLDNIIEKKDNILNNNSSNNNIHAEENLEEEEEDEIIIVPNKPPPISPLSSSNSPRVKISQFKESPSPSSIENSKKVLNKIEPIPKDRTTENNNKGLNIKVKENQEINRKSIEKEIDYRIENFNWNKLNFHSIGDMSKYCTHYLNSILSNSMNKFSLKFHSVSLLSEKKIKNFSTSFQLKISLAPLSSNEKILFRSTSRSFTEKIDDYNEKYYLNFDSKTTILSLSPTELKSKLWDDGAFPRVVIDLYYSQFDEDSIDSNPYPSDLDNKSVSSNFSFFSKTKTKNSQKKKSTILCGTLEIFLPTLIGNYNGHVITLPFSPSIITPFDDLRLTFTINSGSITPQENSDFPLYKSLFFHKIQNFPMYINFSLVIYGLFRSKKSLKKNQSITSEGSSFVTVDKFIVSASTSCPNNQEPASFTIIKSEYINEDKNNEPTCLKGYIINLKSVYTLIDFLILKIYPYDEETVDKEEQIDFYNCLQKEIGSIYIPIELLLLLNKKEEKKNGKNYENFNFNKSALFSLPLFKSNSDTPQKSNSSWRLACSFQLLTQPDENDNIDFAIREGEASLLNEANFINSPQQTPTKKANVPLLPVLDTSFQGEIEESYDLLNSPIAISPVEKKDKKDFVETQSEIEPKDNIEKLAQRKKAFQEIKSINGKLIGNIYGFIKKKNIQEANKYQIYMEGLSLNEPQQPLPTYPSNSYSATIQCFPFQSKPFIITPSIKIEGNGYEIIDHDGFLKWQIPFEVDLVWNLLQRSVAFLRIQIFKDSNKKNVKSTLIGSCDLDLVSLILGPKNYPFCGMIPVSLNTEEESFSINKKNILLNSFNLNSSNNYPSDYISGWVYLGLAFLENNNDIKFHHNGITEILNEQWKNFTSLISPSPALFGIHTHDLVSHSPYLRLSVSNSLYSSLMEATVEPSNSTSYQDNISTLSILTINHQKNYYKNLKSVCLHILLDSLEITIPGVIYREKLSNTLNLTSIKSSISLNPSPPSFVCFVKHSHAYDNIVAIAGKYKENLIDNKNNQKGIEFVLNSQVEWDHPDILLQGISFPQDHFLCVELVLYSFPQYQLALRVAQKYNSNMTNNNKIPMNTTKLLDGDLGDSIIKEEEADLLLQTKAFGGEYIGETKVFLQASSGTPLNFTLPIRNTSTNERVGLLAISAHASDSVSSSQSSVENINQEDKSGRNGNTLFKQLQFKEYHRYIKIEFIEGNFTFFKDRKRAKEFFFETSLIFDSLLNSSSSDIVSRTGFIRSEALKNWGLTSRLTINEDLFNKILSIKNDKKMNKNSIISPLSLFISCRDAFSTNYNELGQAKLAIPMGMFGKKSKIDEKLKNSFLSSLDFLDLDNSDPYIDPSLVFEQWLTFHYIKPEIPPLGLTHSSIKSKENSSANPLIGRVRVKISLCSDLISAETPISLAKLTSFPTLDKESLELINKADIATASLSLPSSSFLGKFSCRLLGVHTSRHNDGEFSERIITSKFNSSITQPNSYIPIDSMNGIFDSIPNPFSLADNLKDKFLYSGSVGVLSGSDQVGVEIKTETNINSLLASLPVLRIILEYKTLQERVFRYSKYRNIRKLIEFSNKKINTSPYIVPYIDLTLVKKLPSTKKELLKQDGESIGASSLSNTSSSLRAQASFVPYVEGQIILHTLSLTLTQEAAIVQQQQLDQQSRLKNGGKENNQQGDSNITSSSLTSPHLIRYSIGYPSPTFTTTPPIQMAAPSLSTSKEFISKEDVLEENAFDLNEIKKNYYSSIKVSTFDLLHQESTNPKKKASFDQSNLSIDSDQISENQLLQEHRSLLPVIIQAINQSEAIQDEDVDDESKSQISENQLIGSLFSAPLYYDALTHLVSNCFNYSDLAKVSSTQPENDFVEILNTQVKINPSKFHWHYLEIPLYHSRTQLFTAVLKVRVSFLPESMPFSVTNNLKEFIFGEEKIENDTIVKIYSSLNQLGNTKEIVDLDSSAVFRQLNYAIGDDVPIETLNIEEDDLENRAKIELGLKQAFKLADSDNSNFITANEILEVIRKADIPIKSKNKSFSQTKTLGLSNPTQLLLSLAKPGGEEVSSNITSYDDLELLVSSIFKRLDLDGDGRISWWEWRTVLTAALAAEKRKKNNLRAHIIRNLILKLIISNDKSSVDSKVDMIAFPSPASHNIDSLDPIILTLFSISNYFCSSTKNILFPEEIYSTKKYSSLSNNTNITSDYHSSLLFNSSNSFPALEDPEALSRSKVATRLTGLVSSLRVTNNILMQKLEDALMASQKTIPPQIPQVSMESLNEQNAIRDHLSLLSEHTQALSIALNNSKQKILALEHSLMENQKNLGLSTSSSMENLKKSHSKKSLQQIYDLKQSLHHRLSIAMKKTWALRRLKFFLKMYIKPYLQSKKEKLAHVKLNSNLPSLINKRRSNKLYQKREISALKIQSQYRAHISKKMVKKMLWAIERIHYYFSLVRNYREYKRRLAIRACLILTKKKNMVRYIWMKWLEYKRMKQIKASKVVVKYLRKNLLKNKEKYNNEKLKHQMLINKSAKIIQKNWKLYISFKKVKKLYYTILLLLLFRNRPIYTLPSIPEIDEAHIYAKAVGETVRNGFWSIIKGGSCIKNKLNNESHAVDIDERMNLYLLDPKKTYWITLKKNIFVDEFNNYSPISRSQCGLVCDVDTQSRVIVVRFLENDDSFGNIALNQENIEKTDSISTVLTRCLVENTKIPEFPRIREIQLSFDHPSYMWLSCQYVKPFSPVTSPDITPIPSPMVSSRVEEPQQLKNIYDCSQGYHVNYSPDGEEISSIFGEVIKVDVINELLLIKFPTSSNKILSSLSLSKSDDEENEINSKLGSKLVLENPNSPSSSSIINDETLWISYHHPYINWFRNGTLLLPMNRPSIKELISDSNATQIDKRSINLNNAILFSNSDKNLVSPQSERKNQGFSLENTLIVTPSSQSELNYSKRTTESEKLSVGSTDSAYRSKKSSTKITSDNNKLNLERAEVENSSIPMESIQAENILSNSPNKLPISNNLSHNSTPSNVQNNNFDLEKSPSNNILNENSSNT